MSLLRKLGRGDAKDDDQEFQCVIQLLDESEPVKMSYKKDTIGQWLFDQVCTQLNLIEKDYFGLRYVDSEKQRHWLDPLKTIHKQLKGIAPNVLSFRVKFYPDDPMKLREELTRYFLFLQLRRDLLHGRLLCPPSDANYLAACIIQSEFGDYDPVDHGEDYISEFKMLPKQDKDTTLKIFEIHQSFTGQTPSEAEGNFLTRAGNLNTYGVYPHQVRDTKGSQLYLGITHRGILTFQGNRKTHQFKWNQIRRIGYEGKLFIVHVYMRETEEDVESEKKQHTIGFKCPTTSACRHLWKCAVEQQYFFTLQASNDAPKVRSNKHFFVRGSKFRFSGRCLKEVYAASDTIGRNEPQFTRSASHPTLSRKSSTLTRPSLNTSLPNDKITEDKRKRNTYENAMEVNKPLCPVEASPTEADVKQSLFLPVVTVQPCNEDPNQTEVAHREHNESSSSKDDRGSERIECVESSSEADFSYSAPDLVTTQSNSTASIGNKRKPDLDSQLAELEREWFVTKEQEMNHVNHVTSHGDVATKAKPSVTLTVIKSLIALLCFVLFVLTISLFISWYFDIKNAYLDMFSHSIAHIVRGRPKS